MSGHIKFSSSVSAVDLGPKERKFATLRLPRLQGLLASLEWSVVGSLALLVALGFGPRASNLAAVGFAEDEMNKLDAVHAYRNGDITANAEHPMLMKAFIYLSVQAAQAFSQEGAETISEEAALRLPNVLFGALTVIPLFLLTAAFFDRRTGLLAAGFWSFGINAIAINRIAKEDTLMVFFLLFACYFYLRGKQSDPRGVRVRRLRFFFSGVSFGLMLASKYFPHYFGLNALYHHNFRVRHVVQGETGGKAPGFFYLTVAVAFLIANPPVFLPQVWEYLNVYMGERLLVHTGYFFGGQLYKNTISGTPFWGTPIYFYTLFMAIKVPLLILGAFLIGLAVAIRQWRLPGHAFVLLMFFLWIVPYSLMGAKWLRYTLSLMPFVYMLAAIGVVALGRFVVAGWREWPTLRAIVSALAVLIFVCVPGWQAYAHGPHFALYTNAIGAHHAGYFFPHDEFYDDGLREAIKFVCANAQPGATIGHETPAVTRYYLRKFERPDLSSRAISAADFDPQSISGPAYFIVQRGRIYFENHAKLAFIQANFKKLHEVSIDGLPAAEVFVNETK